MDVQRNGNEKEGIFYLEDEGREIGTMSYYFQDNKLIFEHTEVHPSYGGQGLGRKLVGAGVDFARKNNYKVIPLCKFAGKVFTKTPEYSDVLGEPI